MTTLLDSAGGYEGRRNVTLLYYVTARGNPLYGGAFASGQRYHTYGQQSFMLDFAAAAASVGVRVTFVIEGLECFPIASALEQHAQVYASEWVQTHALRASVALLDVVSESLARAVPQTVPAFALVHHAGARLPDYVASRCSRIVCMTENARKLQDRYSYGSKCVVLHQGVDLERFTSVPCRQSSTAARRVLFYSRLSSGKQDIAMQVVRNLVDRDFELTVLGEGDSFWPLCDAFCDRVIFISYIPCQCIHRFIADFDVVISSGRGVMEGLASGKPTLCAGFGYAGPVTADNIVRLLDYNLTGFRTNRDVNLVRTDLSSALEYPRNRWRELALEYLDMRRFVRLLVSAIRGAESNCENESSYKTII